MRESETGNLQCGATRELQLVKQQNLARVEYRGIRQI